MKSIHLLTVAALALAALTTARGQTVSGSAGDLILGFRTNDGAVTNDLEVDLGQYSQFTSLAPGTVLNLNLNGTYYGSAGGLSASDISTVFGPSWNTLTDLVWSVAGDNGSGASTDLYATFTAVDGATVSQKSGSTQNSPGVRLRAELGGLEGQTSLSSSEAAEIPVSLSSNGNYSGAIRGNGTVNKDYAYFTPSTEAFVSSTGTSSLDLFAEIHGGTGAGTDLGTFALDSAGDLSFTAAAVPEPSTYAAMLLGGATLLSVRRRQKKLTVST
jgi:hypothetical protein